MEDDDLKTALEDLKGASETQRLKGARFFQERATAILDAKVEAAVREAFAAESVPWVRGPLLEVLAAGEPELENGVTIDAPRWDERLETVDPDLARQVLHLTAERMLHEVSSVVGRARLAAGDEMGSDYHASETASQLRFLSNVCTGLRTLSGATNAPAIAEFDLSANLRDLAGSVAGDLLFPIHVEGPGPFMVLCDWTLLHLAVRNVLVNAVEATQSVGPSDPTRAIVLTWGISPGGTHVTVIDRGPGPSRALARIGRAGVSTKPGHTGYGLATASEALRSLGGTVKLHRNDQGGASVVLSWPEGG
ncbi:MAG: ATP-binding protein [Solirubrobacterales bacterium]